MELFLTSVREKIDTIADHILFFVVLVLAVLLVTSLIRLLFGKKNQLGKAFTSAMEILCLYLLTLCSYSLGLHGDYFVGSLPFVSMEKCVIIFFPIWGAGFSEIADHLSRLLLLAFGVNLLNTFIPAGRQMFPWLVLRLASVVSVIFLNYGLDLLLCTLFPQGLGAVAPLILIAALVVLILLGSLKLLVGLALFVANPVIGALYTFFFSNLIGRSLARAVLSAGAITALVYLLQVLGIGMVSITALSLILLTPALLIVIWLWYLIDRIV